MLVVARSGRMNDAFPEETKSVDDTSCYAEIQHTSPDGQHDLKEAKKIEGGSDVFQWLEAELLPEPGLGFKTSISRRGASHVEYHETSDIFKQSFGNTNGLLIS